MLKRKMLMALRIVKLVNTQRLTSRQIASELSIAVSYVEQLCSALSVRSEILSGKRGPGGGYTSGDDLTAFSLNELYQALYNEEPILHLPISIADGLKLMRETPAALPPDDPAL